MQEIMQKWALKQVLEAILETNLILEQEVIQTHQIQDVVRN